MESIMRFIIQKLKLKVNEAKRAVARPQQRKFLAFGFTDGPEVKRAIAPKTLIRFKRRIRENTRRAKGDSIETTIAELAPYMRGSRSYFSFCETPETQQNLTRRIRLWLGASSVAAVKDIPSSPGRVDCTGGGSTTGQENRRQWARSLVSRSVQSSQYRAFQCVLPAARSSVLDRGVLA
jgi:hypothetical protein